VTDLIKQQEKKTRKLIEGKNAPHMDTVYKSRICNPTPLVHQVMTEKTIKKES